MHLPKTNNNFAIAGSSPLQNLPELQMYYNQNLDKKTTKKILSWFLDNYGPSRTSAFLEELKSVGFHYATEAGISLGFDDLKIPPRKNFILDQAENQITHTERFYRHGRMTAIERYQAVIDIWTTASEKLKEEVIAHFQSTDLFNPLYMMAFSGARGNISQVRQLVGMRGLMSDSAGGIIDFPIRKNFREGLTITEYVISCYGARKGLIDTALRTADSGYLTRRLVDVAHGIMIGTMDCGTKEAFTIYALKAPDSNLVMQSLEKRILGRVYAETNEEISPALAYEIIRRKDNTIERNEGKPGLSFLKSKTFSKAKLRSSLDIRSPLTCQTSSINGGHTEDICQLCYGWSLAHGRLVSLGEAVGILAAQSIGEPGTQLTMRTFHTGGIFAGGTDAKLFAPHDGVVSFANTRDFTQGKKIRTSLGQTAFFSFEKIQLKITSSYDIKESYLSIPAYSLLFVYPGQQIRKNSLCAEISYLMQAKASRVGEISQGSQRPHPGLGEGVTAARVRVLPLAWGAAWGKALTPQLTPMSAERSCPEAEQSSAGLGHTRGQGSGLRQSPNAATNADVRAGFAQTSSLLSSAAELPAGPNTATNACAQASPLRSSASKSAQDNNETRSSATNDAPTMTKKVLSDIEGQVYFHRIAERRQKTGVEDIRHVKGVGSLWILNGSLTSTEGRSQCGDFFLARDENRGARSNNRLISSNTKQNREGRNLMSEPYNGKRRLRLSHFNNRRDDIFAFQKSKNRIRSSQGLCVCKTKLSRGLTFSGQSQVPLKKYNLTSSYLSKMRGFIKNNNLFLLSVFWSDKIINKQSGDKGSTPLQNLPYGARASATGRRYCDLGECETRAKPIFVTRGRGEGHLRSNEALARGYALPPLAKRSSAGELRPDVAQAHLRSATHTSLQRSLAGAKPAQSPREAPALAGGFVSFAIRACANKDNSYIIPVKQFSSDLVAVSRGIGPKINLFPLATVRRSHYIGESVFAASNCELRGKYISEINNVLEDIDLFGLRGSQSLGAKLGTEKNYGQLVEPSIAYVQGQLRSGTSFGLSEGVTAARVRASPLAWAATAAKPMSATPQAEQSSAGLGNDLEEGFAPGQSGATRNHGQGSGEAATNADARAAFAQTSSLLSSAAELPAGPNAAINAATNAHAKHYQNLDHENEEAATPKNTIPIAATRSSYMNSISLHKKHLRQYWIYPAKPLRGLRRAELDRGAATSNFASETGIVGQGEASAKKKSSVTETRIEILPKLGDALRYDSLAQVILKVLSCRNVSAPWKWSISRRRELQQRLLQKSVQRGRMQTRLGEAQLKELRPRKSVQIIVRKIHPYVLSNEAALLVHQGEGVSRRQILCELFFEKSKTGDIVQGLPKIEQLFEARRTSTHVQDAIHLRLKSNFFEASKLYSQVEAARQAIRSIQRILVDEIQMVYQSQGVDISDKHIEIIVRQMTSKVIILDSAGGLNSPSVRDDFGDRRFPSGASQSSRTSFGLEEGFTPGQGSGLGSGEAATNARATQRSFAGAKPAQSPPEANAASFTAQGPRDSRGLYHSSRSLPFYADDIIEYSDVVRTLTSAFHTLESNLLENKTSDPQQSRRQNNQSSFSPEFEPIVLGITKRAFLSESWASSASFQEAKKVLMESACESKIDFLSGLKSNLIVGRYIRAGTSFQK